MLSTLSNLGNLEKLNLSNNQISEIKGLGNLVNLKELYIDLNPIPEDVLAECGGLIENSDGKAKDPQAFVKYCEK